MSEAAPTAKQSTADFFEFPDLTSGHTSDSSVLLIDLENCPSQINALLHQLKHYSRVVICYAQSGAKVPLAWLEPLSQALQDQKLKIIHMRSVGKNSADFGISFFAGVLMQEMPANTAFSIVSNDTDLDHVVHLLQSQGCKAQRIGLHPAPTVAVQAQPAKPNPTQPTQAEPAQTKPATAQAQTLAGFCARMISHPNNRPSKPDSLLNALRAHFGQSDALAQNAFKELELQGGIQVDDAKLIYVNHRLAELAH